MTSDLAGRVRDALSAAGVDTAPVDSMVPVIAGWVPAGETARASKIGGRPDLPPGTDWPREHFTYVTAPENPLGFICQIDMSDVAALDDLRRLPAPGMLYLFSIVDSDTAYGWNIDSGNTAVLYLPDPGPLAPRDFPDDLAAKARLAEKPLAFAASLVCEQQVEADDDEDDDYDYDDEDDFSGVRFCRKRFDRDTENAISDALVAAGSHRKVVAMLQNPHFFHGLAASMCDYDHETDIELLYLPGSLLSREFGEGEFHVVIDRKALQAGDLAAATVVFDPGT